MPGDEAFLSISGTHRSPRKAFTVHWPVDDPCLRCYQPIEVGQSARYLDDDTIVHAHHRVAEQPAAVCTSCWLTKPCGCGET